MQQKADARDTPSRQEFLESAVYKVEKLTKDFSEKVDMRRKDAHFFVTCYSLRGV